MILDCAIQAWAVLIIVDSIGYDNVKFLIGGAGYNDALHQEIVV